MERPKFERYRFEDLKVWGLGMDIVHEVYKLIRKFPKDELFALTDQLKRAATSIVLNIAEGSGQPTTKGFAVYLYRAKSSALECVTCYKIALQENFVSSSETENLKMLLQEEYFKLIALEKSIRNKTPTTTWTITTLQHLNMYNQISANKRKTFFLILIFLAVIFGLAWALAGVYGEEYYFFFPLAIIISLIMTLTSYFTGDKVALAMSGAKGPISKEGNSYVYQMVENLCITAGLLMPKVYLIDSPAINAFATGRNPQHASIAVTRGAINKLENEELEGVIAHELSHIKNYDILVMTIVIVLVGVISIITNIFYRSNFRGRRSSNSNNKAGGGLMLVGLVLIILSPIIAQLIKLAVSRKREFLADASGSLLTRYPEGLARALEKIAADTDRLEKVSEATAHLFIANPLSGKFMSKLFSTHPPIEERVSVLRQMGNVK